MTEKAKSFFEYIHGKKVAVMGVGVSNTGLIKMLHERGAKVTARDRRGYDELGTAAKALEALGVGLKLGEDYFEDLDAEILFRTPGMNYNLPELREFHRGGGIVTSEMEVFFELCPCPIIAVTGSDGKTTTTTLISEMLKAQGKTVHLGGNIGRALLPEVLGMEPRDFAVVELSSFQLISMRRSPHIAVVTNISPNHLDVHADMAEYTGAKRNIFTHQNAFSRTVLGADSEAVKAFAPEIRGECLMFSAKGRVERGAWLNAEGNIVLTVNGNDETALRAADIKLPGAHNVLNFMAAICATAGLVDAENIRRVAKDFAGVEHRLEFVREKDGVKWYNDSIATSPTRAIAGLRSFGEYAGKIILLVGGYDKNLQYGPLAPEILKRVRVLLLTGPAAVKIEAAVLAESDASGTPEIIHAEDLPDAVRKARTHAKNGEIVLLSPACASFDAYKNFEARGRHFKELVNEL